MEVWKSPRKIQEEIDQALELERQKQFKLFDDLYELVQSGTITMEDLTSAMQGGSELWTPVE